MPNEAFTYEHSDIPPGMTLAEWRGVRTSQLRHAKAAARGPRRVLWAFFVRRPRRAVVV
jgi:hypothetical protein